VRASVILAAVPQKSRQHEPQRVRWVACARRRAALRRRPQGSVASGMCVGALREVIGVGAWFREEITAYDRPRSYSYLIVRSFPPLKHEGGTLTFTALGDGTRVDWLSNYTHPLHAGGKLMEAVSCPSLRVNFLAILTACAKALEGRERGGELAANFDVLPVNNP
jgi:hypothetical protein